MRNENKIINLIRAVYMPFVYQLIGVLANTLVMEVLSQFFLLTGRAENFTDAYQMALPIYHAHYLLVLVTAALITIPVCLNLLRQDTRKRAVQEGASQGANGWLSWSLLLILGMSSCIALNYWIELSGLMRLFPGYGEVAGTLYSGNLAEEILAIVIAAPVVEELLFRGIVYGRMRDVMAKKWAMAASAIFFGIYHGNVVQGIYAFCIGLLLVYVYERFHTIKAPVLFHAAANGISVFLTEFADIQSLDNPFMVKLWAALICTIAGAASLWGIHKSMK